MRNTDKSVNALIVRQKSNEQARLESVEILNRLIELGKKSTASEEELERCYLGLIIFIAKSYNLKFGDITDLFLGLMHAHPDPTGIGMMRIFKKACDSQYWHPNATDEKSQVSLNEKMSICFGATIIAVLEFTGDTKKSTALRGECQNAFCPVFAELLCDSNAFNASKLAEDKNNGRLANAIGGLFESPISKKELITALWNEIKKRREKPDNIATHISPRTFCWQVLRSICLKHFSSYSPSEMLAILNGIKQ